MLTIPDYQYITSFTNKNITLTHRYSNNKFEQKNCTVKFLHNIRILAKQYSKTVHDTGKKYWVLGLVIKWAQMLLRLQILFRFPVKKQMIFQA